MAFYSSISDEKAVLSATFRSFFDVFSQFAAQVDIDVVNYSTYAINRRDRSQKYWSRFDGITNMLSVYTRDAEDGEEATCDMSSVRDKPRYPQSLCKKLGNNDNALLGYVTNHMVKLGFYMTNFPPPFITADVVFVPAPETTRDGELLMVCISDQSINLVRPTDSSTSCFSHPTLQESQSIIKRGVVRRIGAGTVFVFVKAKEIKEFLAEDRPTRSIMSHSGEEFNMDRKFAQKIETDYGTVPPNLLHMAKVFQYEEANKVETRPLPFEGYFEEMSQGSIQNLMHNILFGVFSNVFETRQTEKLCTVVGDYINHRLEEGVGLMDIARDLGFAQI